MRIARQWPISALVATLVTALVPALSFGMVVAGCGGSTEEDGERLAIRAKRALVESRPYTLKVPSAADGQTPMPVLVLLHGYGASGAMQDLYFGFTAKADAAGFLYAYADGTMNNDKKRFWNASNACCDFEGTGVDDVAYVDAILDDIASKHPVDPRRVYVVGHSNGGFMAHRFGCDRASRVAAVISLAGAVYNDPERCNPSEAISVLQVHGTKDDVIRYEGGKLFGKYPPAKETVATWARKNGCSGALVETGQQKDLDGVLPGAETSVARYEGCPAGIDVELWTIADGAHIPDVGKVWADEAFAFLLAHPKRD